MKMKAKDKEEMINNTLAIKKEYGLDLFPYKCRKVKKTTIYPRVIFNEDGTKTVVDKPD